jgi:hypothetical protein
MIIKNPKTIELCKYTLRVRILREIRETQMRKLGELSWVL